MKTRSIKYYTNCDIAGNWLRNLEFVYLIRNWSKSWGRELQWSLLRWSLHKKRQGITKRRKFLLIFVDRIQHFGHAMPSDGRDKQWWCHFRNIPGHEGGRHMFNLFNWRMNNQVAIIDLRQRSVVILTVFLFDIYRVPLEK